MEKSLTTPLSGCHSESAQPAINVSDLCPEAEDFIERLFLYQCQKTQSARRGVEACLRQRFSRDAVSALLCLLENADESMVLHFARTHLCPAVAAECSSVYVRIAANPDASHCRGNTGCYLIFLERNGLSSVPLNFTNQASMVYYLM